MCEVQANMCNGQINYKRPRAQWACALTAPQSVHHGGPSQWFVNFEQA